MVYRNQLFTGLIAGVVAGTVASLLLAPKTGKETRQFVVARAGEVRGNAGRYATSVRERLRRGQSGAESAYDATIGVAPTVSMEEGPE